MPARLTGLPASWKRLIATGVDAAALVATVYAVLALSFGRLQPPLHEHWPLLLVAPLVTLAVFWLLGVYSAVIRFVNVDALAKLLQGLLCSVVLLLAGYWVFSDLAPVWNLLILYAVCGSFVVGFVRVLAARLLRDAPARGNAPVENVIIYGAGVAGRQIAAALSETSPYRLVGFADDRADMRGRYVMGHRVFAPDELAAAKKRLRVSRILLCIPSVTRQRRSEILRTLEPLATRVMIMPGLNDLAGGNWSVGDLREVQIEDLLGREPVEPSTELMEACIRDQVVMITGAGGSIGSELSRQVVRYGARRLVLFELSELALYQIDMELRRLVAAEGLRTEILPVLGNVLDEARLEGVMARYGVTTIYHAAAYKHVPLVECNAATGIRNNVFGALSTVRVAARCGVGHFVLVSSDKAVRPTSVMGATKRVQELVVQAYAEQHPTMHVAMVRFGNVLASSGSVVPVFQEQIRKGGPVTVTHPEITRFFMTIPEAAQLVIQAGVIGDSGDLYVLDMGQPVKIVDMARRLVRLSGLETRDAEHPDGQIEIVFTGLRPGEKLYEELLIDDTCARTSHPRISKAREAGLEWEVLDGELRRLRSALDGGQDKEALAVLERLVSGYRVFDSAHLAPVEEPAETVVIEDRAPDTLLQGI